MSSDSVSSSTVPVQNNPQNSAQIMDFIFNNIILQKFGDIMKGNFEITSKSILGLLLLVSVTEIKGLVTNIFSDIKPFVRNLPMLLCYLLTKIGSIVRTLTFRKPLMIEQGNKKENFIDIDANDVFLNALYMYIQKYNNDNISDSGIRCKFIESSEKIVLSNIKEGHLVKNITCITFMKDILGQGHVEKQSFSSGLDGKNVHTHFFASQVAEITIMNPITYNISIKTKEPLSNAMVGVLNTDPKKITSLLDMFNDKQRKVIDIIDKKVVASTSNSVHTGWSSTIIKDKNAEYVIANAILKNYPSFNLENTIKIIGIVSHVMRQIVPNGNPLTHTREILQSGKLILDVYHSYEKDMLDDCKDFLYDKKLGQGTSYTGKSSEKLKKSFGDFVGIILPKTDATSTNSTLHLKYTNNIKSDVNYHVEQLIEDIYTCQKVSNGSIIIYYLTQEKILEFEEKNNPAYIAWYEKKKMMDTLDDGDDDLEIVKPKKGKKANKHKASLINDMPPKTITVEKYISKINVKMLNDSSKDINTLYLRKEDRFKLINSLNQFKYEKETLKELGLPNKLNTLFYGPPGTGKSTAITAIATFLNRNIYYIDIKNVTTNDDLRMMFEHVNKNVQNGGIIVMEDIDCMSNVVLKRENRNKSELNVNGLMASSNDSLSLEYLLNILQGTLTMDDSIFIVTTNHIDHLDPAFYRDGRFDVKIELKLCDHYQIDQIYEKYMKRKIPTELLKRIPEDKYSPANIIFHVKDYIFDKTVSDETILARFMQ